MANIKISELNPLLTVEDADVLPIVDNGVTKKVTAAILQSYTQGNSVLLTGAQTVAGIKTFTSQLASSVATGTAPFSVASTTKVTNLNADLLDGLSSADFQATLSGTGIVKSTAGTISYLTDNTANWDTAYNDKINSAAVTGSGTNTLTLTQQDAGTITATWVNGTLIREVRNTTGATLTKGTIVYISGATGNKPTVTKAIASGDSTSAQTFGFIQSDLANNDNGYVVVVGDLTGVDTSAFAEGDQLYLSSTVAGAFTSTKQYAPAHLVYVGIVTRSHPTLGQIEVNIQNGYELDELHNVSAQSPSNGDILQFVTSTGLWTKVAGTTTNISEGTNLYFTNARSRSAISLTTTGTSGAATYNSTTGVLNVPNYADGGITSLNGLTALSQTFAVGTSGTDFGISSSTSTHTFNLPTASATNRGALSSADWTNFNNKQNALTNPITGTGTTNYLPKFTGTSALGDSLIYDNGTNVGIGTISPATKLQVSGGRTSLFSGDAYSLILAQTSSQANIVYLGTQSDGTFNISNNAGNPQLTLTQSGNLGLGTTTPQTKLVVNGAGYSFISGFTSANRSVAIGVDSSSEPSIQGTLTDGTARQLSINPAGGNVGIGTASPTVKLDVLSSGVSAFIRSTGNPVPLSLFNSSSTVASIGFKGSTSANEYNVRVGADVNDFVAFTADTERMRITSAGNVGIGTSSPSHKLEVNGNGVFGVAKIGSWSVSSNFARFGHSSFDGGTTFGFLQSDVADTFINGANCYYSGTKHQFEGGNVLIGTSTDAGYKLDVNGTARVSGNLTATGNVSSYGQLRLETSAYGSIVVGSRSSQTDFQIYNTGNIFRIYDGTSDALSINTSGAATFSSSVTATQLKAANPSECSIEINCTTGSGTAWRFNSYNNGNLYLQSDGGILNKGIFDYTTGVYTALSDVNKKKDFEDSKIGLKEVLGLKPTLYRMKTDNESAPKNLGFIAQEVKEFIPQAYVESGEEDNKFIGLSDRPIIAALVKAVQEQNQLILDLQSRLDSLELK